MPDDRCWAPIRRTALADLYEVRRPLYESVAAVTVDVDDLSPAEVADRVLAEVGLAGSGTP